MSEINCYYDFTGGLNDSFPPAFLNDNELRVAENAVILPFGGLKKRKGTKNINSVSLNGDVTQIIEWELEKGITKTIAIANRRLYMLNSITGELVQVEMPESEALADDKIAYFFYRGIMYFSDGKNFYSWGDGNIYRGSFNYTQKAAVKAGSIVKLTPGPEEATRDSYSKTDTDVLYRRIDRANEPFFEAGFINKPAYSGTAVKNVENAIYKTGNEYMAQHYYFNCNTNLDDEEYNSFFSIGILNHYYRYIGYEQEIMPMQTNYTDTRYWTDVTSEGGTSEVILNLTSGEYETYLNKIKRCRFFVYHSTSGRIFASGDIENPTAVYYSEPGKPTVWPDTNVLYPIPDNGNITALAFLGKYLMVANREKWVFTSEQGFLDGETVTFKVIPSGFGCISEKTLQKVTNGIVFLADEGLCYLGESLLNDTIINVKNLSNLKILTQNKADNIIKSIPNKTDSAGVYHKNTYYLSFKSEGSPVYDTILVYNFGTGSFVTYRGISANCFLSTMAGELYFGTRSYICKMYSGNTDFNCIYDGSSEKIYNNLIRFIIKTKPLCFNDKHRFKNKRLNTLYIAGQKNTVDDEITVSITASSGYHTKTYSVDFNNDLVWGRNYDKHYGYDSICVGKVNSSLKGGYFEFEISNNSLCDEFYILYLGFEFDVINDVSMPRSLKETYINDLY